MKYVRETNNGVLTGLLKLDGDFPYNPPYEYEEITEAEYNRMLQATWGDMPPTEPEQPETPGTKYTREEMDAFLAGQMDGAGL